MSKHIKNVCGARGVCNFITDAETVNSAYVLPSNPVAPNQEINPKGTEVPFGFMVEATGFEPTTLWSRTIRATNCATPQYGYSVRIYYIFKKFFRQMIFIGFDYFLL